MPKIHYRALALAGALLVSHAHTQADGFADSVVAYTPGAGFSSGFTNAAVTLGPPTASATPFAPAFQKTQLLSLGAGGSLTVEFAAPIQNDPAHPFGLDFSIFGNSFFVESGVTATGAIFGSAPGTTRVSVSQDGANFYTLDPALAPTVNYAFPTDGSGDPALPVNPALTPADFTGQNLAGIRLLYNGSAGGSSYDISWAEDGNGNPANLSDISFVRVDVLSGKAQIDSFSVVPEPVSAYLMIPGLVLLKTPRRRRKRERTFVKRSAPGILPISGMSVLMLFLAARFAVAALVITVSENFSTNPAAHGWQVYGDTNAFAWDSTNQNLSVTWDSSKPNSYFYRPLGTILARDDDFSVSFDLKLNQITAGVNSNKPDAIEVALGFFNYADATNGIVRGSPVYPPAAPDPKNLVEFDYFPFFIDPSYGAIPASIAPTFVSSNYAFDGAFGDDFTFTNGVTYHVQLTYTATNSTLTTIVTPPGSSNVLITATATLSGTNDFRVDTFSISSYTDAGDDYDSLLGNGTVDNLVIMTPAPPAQNLSAGYTNGMWQVQFSNRTNWLYSLQRTTDFQTWQAASGAQAGNGTTLTLSDTNPPPARAFFRVSAQRP